MGFLGGLGKALGGAVGAVGGVGKAATGAVGGMFGRGKASMPKPPMAGPAPAPMAKRQEKFKGPGMSNIRTMGRR